MDNNSQQNFYSENINFENPVKPSLKALKDPLFLALCILVSISAALSFDIFSILIAIGMWMSFANIQKAKSPISGAKLTAGTLKALYILNWVAVPFVFLGGAMLFIFSGAIGRSEEVIIAFDKYIIAEFDFYEYLSDAGLSGYFSDIGAAITIIAIVAGITLMISAIILIVLNIFFYSKLYKFADSIKNSICYEYDNVVCADTVKTWFLVLAIFNGISLPSSLFSESGFLSVAITVAIYIIAYIWIKNYFSKPTIDINV